MRCQDSDKRDRISVRFVVFDAPLEKGSAVERLDAASLALTTSSWARVLTHVVCSGHAHVMTELDRVLTLRIFRQLTQQSCQKCKTNTCT